MILSTFDDSRFSHSIENMFLDSCSGSRRNEFRNEFAIWQKWQQVRKSVRNACHNLVVLILRDDEHRRPVVAHCKIIYTPDWSEQTRYNIIYGYVHTTSHSALLHIIIMADIVCARAVGEDVAREDLLHTTR